MSKGAYIDQYAGKLLSGFAYAYSCPWPLYMFNAASPLRCSIQAKYQ